MPPCRLLLYARYVELLHYLLPRLLMLASATMLAAFMPTFSSADVAASAAIR